MSLLKRIPRVVTVVAGLLFVSACESLVVSDPNDPDRSRVLASAPSVEALLAGGLNGWMNIHQGMDPDGALTTMADNYTASWNNFQMRIYSSEPRTSWQNDPASSAKVEIESYWYAEYASLAAANAALVPQKRRLRHGGKPRSDVAGHVGRHGGAELRPGVRGRVQ